MLKKIPDKFLISSVALLLCLAIVFTSYLSVVGHVVAYGATYISEVKVFSGSSLSDAISRCRKAGYKPVEKNLNRSEDGDEEDNGIYIVGYLTTDNSEEAITDISMLQMNSGYQDYTYGDIAEQAIRKMGYLPDEIMFSVDEFAENYAKGSPAALVAAEVLNCYHIDEMNSKPLGDFLASGNCTVDFIKKLFARSSTAVITAVCNALVAGVAEYGEGNWAQRLCENTEIRDDILNDEKYRDLDIMYKDYASELTESIQDFSSSFHDAENRYYANNKKAELPESEETDMTVLPEETAEQMENCAEIQTEDGDSMILAAYDLLNGYDYDENTGLGEYLVALGDNTYETIESLRALYPFVSSITNGQVAVMRLSGITLNAIYLANDESLSEEADEQVNAVRKDIKSATGEESLSIWEGTDQTVYNQKVAVTSAAYRANSAGQIYNTLTTPDSVDTFVSESMSKLGIITGVIGFAYSLTYLAASAIGSMSAMAIGSVGVSASIWTVCCASIGSGVLGSIFGVLGCAIIVLNYIAIAAMVIVLVVMFVKWIWDMCTDDDAEDFTPIPSVLFDLAENRYVKYEAVNEGDSPANINGSNARRWNALYYSKSSYAGEPICSSEAEDLFTVQYNNSSTPIGYEPVKCFGEVTAANLNSNSKSDSASIFLFFKATENEINKGEQQEGSSYISKLSLSVSNSETSAKAALTKSGYHVLDINLTPATADDKKYTYLGFTTTTNPQDAVTDIRISPRNTAEAFLFGNASYASCGTTPTGDTLYYTSYASAGSPILADIKIVNSLKEAPEGYEPVNMFCGGTAFNFNTGSEMENIIYTDSKSVTYDHWNDSGKYIFFRPSVTYTEGEEYISGFVIVAGTKAKHGTDTVDDYCKAMGLTKIENSLTYGYLAEYVEMVDRARVVEEVWKNVDTCICYTTTHNPYRAIYGVKSYTSAPGNTSVPSSVGALKTGAYSVCDIMFELPYTCEYGKQDIDEFVRGIYESHSYQFPACAGEMTGLRQVPSRLHLSPEDYETVDWKYSESRGKGLYVLGPVSGGTPLTVTDILVSDDSTVPDGYSAVQDFRTPNRTEAHNLGYSTADDAYQTDDNKPVYMYIRQKTAEKKTYISSVSVATYSLSNATGGKEDKLEDEVKEELNKTCNDYCVQSLLSQECEEIIQYNIAVDRSKSFYGDSDTGTSTASYIGVTRTDDETEAVTGIIRYVTKSDEAPSVILVGGGKYTRAGDKIYDAKGAYYLYYTKSKSANPGMPVTDIDVSEDVFTADAATAMSANDVDIPQIKEGDEIIQEAVYAPTYGDANVSSFIHMTYKDTANLMSGVFIGHGKTKKEAQCNLLTLGCNMCIDMDLNKDAGGEYIYVGYTRYTMTSREKKTGAKYAVRDIVLTVGEEHQKTLTIDGVEYKPAVDEYTSVKDYDGVEAVSLNRGAGGKQIYMYYTTKKIAGSNDTRARLGASCRDFCMVNTEDYKWENITDRNGNRVNVNDGAICTTDDGEHIVDNRIYLYASRCNNSVKEGSAVTDDQMNAEYKTYDVYMRGVTSS